MGDHENDLLPSKSHWPREDRHDQAASLRSYPRVSTRHSDSLRVSSLSVSHCLQERAALLPHHRMASEAFRTGLHRPAESRCFDWQHPFGAQKSESGRTPDGEIKPFLPGAFFLAIKAHVDIVPIALVGTYELLPMNTYHIKCRPLEMRVGDPISTAGLSGHDMEALSARVQKAIEDLHRQRA